MRPKKDDKDKQNNRVYTYVTDDELVHLKLMAKAEKCKSVSQYIRYKMFQKPQENEEKAELSNDQPTEIAISKEGEDFIGKQLFDTSEAIQTLRLSCDSLGVGDKLSPDIARLNRIFYRVKDYVVAALANKKR